MEHIPYYLRFRAITDTVHIIKNQTSGKFYCGNFVNPKGYENTVFDVTCKRCIASKEKEHK